MSARPERYDAVVIGARVAGAATAMLLARAGLKVLAVDRGTEGSDTLSTHALMRGAVLQLARWGLVPALEAAGTPPIRSTTFHYGDETITVAIKPRDGVEALLAPRRTVLDPLLVGAARAAGAEVRHGLRALDLVKDASGRVRGAVLAGRDGGVREVQAGVVVGADGLRSGVARLAGARTRFAGRYAAATLYRYVPGLALEGYDWHYRPGVAAGAIPTNGGQAAVFVSLPQARWRRERADGLAPLYARVLAEAAPELAARMPALAAGGALRTFDGVPGFLRQAHGPGWALVGDAGAFRDPITSHGITDALRDAEWLAQAIVRGSEAGYADYEAARDDILLDMVRVTDTIASFEWTRDEVKALHLELSRQMSRGVEAIRLGAQSLAA